MRKDQSLVGRTAAGAGAFLLAAALNAGAATADSGTPAEAREFAEKMNQIGSETLSRVTGARGDNTVVVSPYGLGAALHLLLLGAGGPAEKSLQAMLLPSGVVIGKQDAGLMTLKRDLLGASRDKLRLTLSTAVFVPKSAESVEPSRRFVARARTIFGAPVEALDFKSAGALEQINAWAKEMTQGLVPRVIEELDPEARFVLSNAVHFHGAWERAFSAERTAKAPFMRVDGSTRETAMMDATLPVDFAELDNLRAVWLPYDGKEVAMLIIAPAEREAPTAMAEALKRTSIADLWAAALQRRRTASVRVRLPRFRAESNLDITGVLSRQGLAPALSAGSNYTAINRARSGPLQVTQRAVLEVTEAGTKAAAATAITSNRSLAVTPLFAADRPFAFAIVHGSTQAILFAGYVADPGDDPGPATEPKGVR